MAKTAEAPTTTRPRKSPEQKAQAALDKAQRDYDRAVERRSKLDTQIAEIDVEVTRAERYLAFAQANPDLPAPASAQEELPTAE
jgi:hypothetical protein